MFCLSGSLTHWESETAGILSRAMARHGLAPSLARMNLPDLSFSRFRDSTVLPGPQPGTVLLAQAREGHQAWVHMETGQVFEDFSGELLWGLHALLPKAEASWLLVRPPYTTSGMVLRLLGRSRRLNIESLHTPVGGWVHHAGVTVWGYGNEFPENRLRMVDLTIRETGGAVSVRQTRSFPPSLRWEVPGGVIETERFAWSGINEIVSLPRAGHANLALVQVSGTFGDPHLPVLVRPQTHELAVGLLFWDLPGVAMCRPEMTPLPSWNARYRGFLLSLSPPGSSWHPPAVMLYVLDGLTGAGWLLTPPQDPDWFGLPMSPFFADRGNGVEVFWVPQARGEATSFWKPPGPGAVRIYHDVLLPGRRWRRRWGEWPSVDEALYQVMLLSPGGAWHLSEGPRWLRLGRAQQGSYESALYVFTPNFFHFLLERAPRKGTSTAQALRTQVVWKRFHLTWEEVGTDFWAWDAMDTRP